MQNAFQLEEFDAPANRNAIDTEALERDAYQRGFEAGIIAAQDARARAEIRGADDLAQSFSDIEITYEGAYQDVLSGFQSLVSDLCELVVPQMCQATLVPRILEFVSSDGAFDRAGLINISVSPADFAVIQDDPRLALPESLRFSQAPELLPGEVTISAENRETMLDHASLARAMADAIAWIYEDNPHKETGHG